MNALVSILTKYFLVGREASPSITLEPSCFKKISSSVLMIAKQVGFISLFVFSVSPDLNAQQERKHIRQGIRDYHGNEFDNAEVNFRKALDENENSWEASFNAGNSLYRLEKHEDAVEMYNKLLKTESDKDRKADLFYNIGNTHLSRQEFAESIDAYRNALRNRPEDENARYNLAYAMSMLEEQENQDEGEKPGSGGRRGRSGEPA
jgi:Ca-activated chloride channel homolog